MVLWRPHSSHTLKTPYQIEKIEEVTRSLYRLYGVLERSMVRGSSGRILEQIARGFARAAGLELPLQDFHGFPSVLCVNSRGTVAHGVPDDREFEDGDVVIVDTVLSRKGWCADASWTWCIGRSNPGVEEFLARALRVSIRAAGAAAGGLYAMAREAEGALESKGALIAQFTGHGIGKDIHELPRIPLVSLRPEPGDQRDMLPIGTVFTVEPVVVDSPDPVVSQAADGSWNLVVPRLAAQFELMVAMEPPGPRILGLTEVTLKRLTQNLRFDPGPLGQSPGLG